MDNSDMPAMPLANSSTDFISSNLSHANGLTKREYFAAMAMQGLCANSTHDGTWSHDDDTVAVTAVDYADALLAALDNDQP